MIPGASQQTIEQLEFYLNNSVASSTKKGYEGDFTRFQQWCDEKGLESLPATPETVMLFVTHLAETHKVTTMERYMSAINVLHADKGQPRPARTSTQPMVNVWKGIVRTKGRAKEQKEALLIEDIQKMVSRMGDDLKSVRDKAILLWGYATACRRSEIEDMEVSHVTFTSEGAKLLLPRSKSDQEGRGVVKGVLYGTGETCPIEALRRWITMAQITDGPLFRSIDRHGSISHRALQGRSVNAVVKAACTLAGMSPAPYGAHSLRSGFATQAARSGVHEIQIMRHLGHSSTTMTRHYIQAGGVFTDSPTGSIGL